MGYLVMDVQCPCGEDHSADPRWQLVLRLVAEKGETIAVGVEGQGSWEVPRAWIAIHGLKAVELGAIADRYGWRKRD
jgi:hypothetical protein